MNKQRAILKRACKGCGKKWEGLEPEHCTTCHETFSGPQARSAHRVGRAMDLTCSLEGLEFDPKRRVYYRPRQRPTRARS